MRITSSTMLANAIRQLRAGQVTLDRAQLEAASGRRVRTLSDDPVAASRIMRLEGEVRDLDQFVRNGASATTRLSTEDTVLNSIRTVLADARKVAIGVQSDDPTSEERQSALREITHMLDEIISLANTRVGEEYIFSGDATDQPAFLPDGSYGGSNTTRTVEIDRGVRMQVNHLGSAVVSPTIQALQQLQAELATGTQASVQAMVGVLQSADDTLLVAQADAGSRLLQVKQAASDIGRRSSVLLDQRDSLRDADPAEASVRMIAAQSALERAYEVIGRVFSVSLMDHLR